MAATYESPAQFDRDLRSANKAWKRNKDSSTKWSLGARHLPGAPSWFDLHPEDHTKGRPLPKHSDSGHHSYKPRNNTNKTGQANWQQRNGRPRGKFGGVEEISDVSRSVADLLVPAARKESMFGSALGDVLYSFDRTDSPGRPVTLDAYVKANNGGHSRTSAGRATERLVEAEYEVIDGKGEALKGRKARRDLRKAVSNVGRKPVEAEDLVEDDGFALV